MILDKTLIHRVLLFKTELLSRFSWLFCASEVWSATVFQVAQTTVPQSYVSATEVEVNP